MRLAVRTILKRVPYYNISPCLRSFRLDRSPNPTRFKDIPVPLMSVNLTAKDNVVMFWYASVIGTKKRGSAIFFVQLLLLPPAPIVCDPPETQRPLLRMVLKVVTTVPVAVLNPPKTGQTVRGILNVPPLTTMITTNMDQPTSRKGIVVPFIFPLIPIVFDSHLGFANHDRNRGRGRSRETE